MKMWGCSPFDNVAFLEGNPPALGKFRYFINQFMWWPTRRVHLDITNVTKERLWDFYQRCLKIKPVYIEGYVGAIQEFAEFMIVNNLQLPSVSFVWTTSAPLTNSTRKIICNAFKCPVYDQYGCCEVYWLGAEICPGRKLHVFDTFRHLDIVDDNGRNCDHDEYGYVLITDMLNYAFPLIRYQNGDRAAKAKDCACGVTNFGVMLPVKGRVTENISLKGGGFIPGEFLTTLFDDFPRAVAQFQVIQNEDYSLNLTYVANDGKHAEKELEQALNYIRALFEKADADFVLTPVKSIKHDAGKLRYVISKVNNNKTSHKISS